MRSLFGAVVPLAILLAAPVAAQEGRTVFYGGLGYNLDDEAGLDATPFAIGIFRQAPTSRLVLGFDIAGEGTMLDSTYGDNEYRQALSFNVLAGTQVASTGTMRIDAGLLLGVRETVSDCPDSFLGYQCYADAPPDTEYGVNYGAVVSATFGRTMIGVRATGESVQGLVGFSF